MNRIPSWVVSKFYIWGSDLKQSNDALFFCRNVYLLNKVILHLFVSERHPYNRKLCNNQLHKKKLNHYRAVNPPHLKVLSHDAQHMTSFILYKNTHWLWSSQMFAMTQSAQKRCCWHCSIWPDWFTSHQSHYCLH